jgi:hypothetical protein
MLAIWPVVTLCLFLMLSPSKALIWSVLAAYLLLPVNTAFELPAIPPLDKTAIPNLSILLCCLIFVRERWLSALTDPAPVLLMLIFIFSPFLTSINNPTPLIYGERFIPAMSTYDALAQSSTNLITLIPFVAGYGILKTEFRHQQLLRAIVIAALAYSVLMLIEIRLSPQLHRMIYGFFPHDFSQQMRGGGFRPVVFLGHGLLVAIFCAMAIIAALSQWRTAKGGARTQAGMIAIYFWGVLILCKSLGAAILALLLAPVLAFARANRIALCSALLCVIIVTYPAIRAGGLIPVNSVSALTKSFSADREGSLNTRLVNEDKLLERGAIKPWFGWGSWGRSRVYNEETGRDESITDGAWIIVLGTWGWGGYLSMFGLLCVGCIRLLWKRKTRKNVGIAGAAIMTILTINLLDSIPNSSIRPITWLLAGVVAAIPPNRRDAKTAVHKISGNQSL